MLTIRTWKQFDIDQKWNQFDNNFAGHFVMPLSDCGKERKEQFLSVFDNILNLSPPILKRLGGFLFIRNGGK